MVVQSVSSADTSVDTGRISKRLDQPLRGGKASKFYTIEDEGADAEDISEGGGPLD